MSLYDYDPVLMNYMAQQKAKQAQVPPALIPPQAKKGWMDKLGSMLIQGDESWQPDDATRKQMVKKGLLEAGLSMLANPTGGDGSALAGISGGLLKGIGQMNNEANELRGRSYNVNSNRMTDTQRAMAIIQDPNATAQVREAAMVFLKLNPPAKAETYSTGITPSGLLYQGSNKGGGNVFDGNNVIPFGAQQQPANPQGSYETPPPAGMNAKIDELNGIARQMKAQGKSDAEIQAFVDKFMAGVTQDYTKTETSLPGVDLPPPRPPSNVALPNLSKPVAPNSFNRMMSAQEVESAGLPVGTSAQVDSAGKVTVLNKPVVEPKKQADANVVKQAAQLPSLLRRIERVSKASEALSLGFGVNGGPLDQYALKVSEPGIELDAAVGQLRSMLMPFVRVPGVGSQSDLEARLDGLQYPDASQPPAVRKRNIDELNAFVADLSRAYTTIIKGGNAPAQQSQERTYNPKTGKIE